MKSLIVLILGIAVLAAGLLFTLQGAGVVHWPADSFMLGKPDWTERGIVVILIGLALVFTARRIRKT
ncbi:MAG TPA: hypothetical protein VGC16_03020 [Rhizomicrobium sp.]